MLDTCVELGIETVELGCANWSKAPHVQLDELLADVGKRRQFKQELDTRGIEIAALNCSGNQLYPGERGKLHKEGVNKTIQLANLLEVDKIVMMSGCPGGSEQDTTPNWITNPILQEHYDIMDWQWNKVFFPYWHAQAAYARENGVHKIALENHGYNLVSNPETFLKLRNEVGLTIGINFDPSHLMWMGGDPITAIRTLGNSIYHVHAKDVRIERYQSKINGLIDVKPMSEFHDRSWNYVALGYGHDLAYWKEFFVNLKMVGYEGPVVLEMEDVSMTPLTGVVKSMEVLKQAVPRIFDEVQVKITR
ncbi:MAG: sugar phosphate isomerase/epimerase [Solibacillus sp.]